MLSYIVWEVNPEIFSIGPVTVRWYGLLWALAIYSAWIIVQKLFKYEKYPENWSDKLFLYTVTGLIVGARLGHCLFYGADGDFFYYYKNPFEMIKVWEGGLASHGGAFGILIAMYFYNKNVTKKGYIWIFDRLVIGVAVGGALIRLGNLMNHEIYGGPTDLPWGFQFIMNLTGWMNGDAPVFTVPSHPTQIYEILYCLVTFGVVWWMYWKKQAYRKRGLIFGVFLLGIFGTRFLLEFIKLNQEVFEANMFFNMGQLLSLPFIIWGVWLIVRAVRSPEVDDSLPQKTDGAPIGTGRKKKK